MAGGRSGWRLVAAGVAAAVALSGVAEAQTECLSEVEADSCMFHELGCAWTTSVDANGTMTQACLGCTTFNNDPQRCSAHCTYDAATGRCGPAEIGGLVDNSFAQNPVSGATTNIAEGTLQLAASTGTLTTEQQDDLTDALAASLGAERVILNAVSADSCGAAPLCGSDPQMIDFVADFHNVPIPELAACCPARETVKTLGCQSIDPEAPACRVAGVQEAFCSDLETGKSIRCAALRDSTLRQQVFMNLRLGFDLDGADVTCCKHCTCYGDPNCVSFDGTKASWRLCDGRDTRTDKRCEITKTACQQRTDHTGAACKWKQDWDAFWKDGSPCQVDKNSPDSWLLMYQADEFRFDVRQEERGVIREVRMTNADGTLSLTAEDCLSKTGLSSWTWDGFGPIPVATGEWSRVNEAGQLDVIWFVNDGPTKIQAKIRCTGTKKPGSNNKYGNFRLNVETLVEPEETFLENRTNVDGFCATNSLLAGSQVQSTELQASLQEHLAVDAICQNIQATWTDGEVLAVARQLCGGGLSIASMDSCFEDWCVANAFPNTLASDCMALFKARDLEEAFCSVMESSSLERTKCVDDIDEFGWEAKIDEFNTDRQTTGGIGGSGCVSNFNDLPISLTECQAGVVLQFQAIADDEDSWTDYVAFPEGVSLCNNEMMFRASTHETLFLHPLRFKQCNQAITCAQLDQCSTQSGLRGVLEYDWPETLPPGTPTFAPSVAPTLAPVGTPVTNIPSRVPTASPTIWPTPVPTDGDESIGPTASPTIWPTPVPTDGDGSIGPTASPTIWPTPVPSDGDGSVGPTASPTIWPTPVPSDGDGSVGPTASPTIWPTPVPSDGDGSSVPTTSPTIWPTPAPTDPIRRLLREGSDDDDAKALVVSPRRMTRDLLDGGRLIYNVDFTAIFPSAASQASTTQVAENNPAALADTVTTEIEEEQSLQAIDSIAALDVVMRETYKIEVIRFTTIPYDPAAHHTETFLQEVCEAVRKTINKRTSLSGVECGTKLFNFQSYPDINGFLAVTFELYNIKVGAVHKMLRTDSGQQTLKNQLESSNLDYIKQLGAAFSRGDGEGATTVDIVIIAGAAMAAVALVAAGVAFRRYKKNNQPVDTEQLTWNMVQHYKRTGKTTEMAPSTHP
ncbi:Uncharacterized protein SCF082_LOCUS2553 [Durusdinium trenchii]|uniref:Uncharacterized protein n=1 Tax=Durusdinium trenchii TaxID=1381693 RepID=A0ABP0HLU3_9DINO